MALAAYSAGKAIPRLTPDRVLERFAPQTACPWCDALRKGRGELAQGLKIQADVRASCNVSSADAALGLGLAEIFEALAAALLFGQFVAVRWVVTYRGCLPSKERRERQVQPIAQLLVFRCHRGDEIDQS